MKIDLLPNWVRHAITNKKLLAVLVLLLLVWGLGVASLLLKTGKELSVAQDELDNATRRADEMRKIEGEAQAISGRLKPISDKVDFIAQADESGYAYWDRFYEIAEYIYGGAELHFFGIMARPAGGLVGDGTPEALYNLAGPAGVDCAFAVTVKNTNEAARFILNMIRCPELSDIRISYSIPPGRVIAARWPDILSEWGLPGFELPTGSIPGIQLGGAAGAMGGQGGGGQVLQPRMDGPVEIMITAQLNRPIMVPQPPGAAAPAAAAPGAPGGMPGMAPDMMGGGPPGPPAGGGDADTGDL